jgi:hypothetical protein
MTWRF